jgi:hypothetical protein
MGNKKGKGGRYTAPGTKPSTRSTPSPVLHVDDDRAFWAALREKDRELQQRCARLVDPAPSPSEWADAALMDMDGFDASDEELVAYWRVHRDAVASGYDFSPELADITNALKAGIDPVEHWRATFHDDDDDDDDD